jgi:hypothetical protein
MATDAKPVSPAPEDPMDAEPEAEKAESGAEEEEEQEDDGDEEEQQPKKRGRRKKLAGEERALASPASERPSRERKTVERYAELTPRSTSAKKTTVILQVKIPILSTPFLPPERVIAPDLSQLPSRSWYFHPPSRRDGSAAEIDRC